MKEKIKNLTKKQKTTIGVVSGIVVAIIAIIAVLSANSTWVYTNAIYALMPKTIEDVRDVGELKMGVVKKKNVDMKLVEKQPLEAFSYYYYDLDGNKIEVDSTDSFMFGEEKITPSAIFAIAVYKNFAQLKDNLLKAVLIAVPILAVIGIVIWFFVWSRKDDEEKAKAYKNKNKNKKSKKK